MVKCVASFGNPLMINATFQSFEHFVLENIIPVKKVYTVYNQISYPKNNFLQNFSTSQGRSELVFSVDVTLNPSINFNILTKWGNFFPSSKKSDSDFVELPPLNGGSSNNISREITESTSERFNTYEIKEEEDDNIESIDNASYLFTRFKKESPTLEKALESMGYVKHKDLDKDFLERGKDKLSELESTGITTEELAAIFCYTFE